MKTAIKRTLKKSRSEQYMSKTAIHENKETEKKDMDSSLTENNMALISAFKNLCLASESQSNEAEINKLADAIKNGEMNF